MERLRLSKKPFLMLRNTALLVASCLIAGSPLLAQEKAAPKKTPLPPPVVHQKEVTVADVKKHEKEVAASKEVSNPKGKMVKFKPPVVKKDESKVEEVPLPPPPPPPPVIKKDAKVPPPPPPVAPKKKD